MHPVVRTCLAPRAACDAQSAAILSALWNCTLALVVLFWAFAAGAAEPSLDPAFQKLRSTDFTEKAAGVALLEQSQHPRTLIILQALLNGDLYKRKSDQRIVIGTETDDDYAIADAATGKALGKIGKRKMRKITIDNQIRGRLRETIARLSLSNPDASVRLKAVREMLDNITPAAVAALHKLQATEKDDSVREVIDVGLALADLDKGDEAARLAAVETLSHSLNPAARNRLQKLLTQDADGGYAEADAKVRTAAKHALAAIERRAHLYRLAETTFFGLSLGSVLLLAAIGLAITFGVMGVINMAHGELMMLGAYTTYVVQLAMPNHIGASLFVAVPAAFLVAGAFGVLIERGVIRFLYGRPLETLLATFGISLILQQLVRTVFSPLNRSVQTPEWMSGSWHINSVFSLTYNRLYILIFGLLVFAALLLVLKKTSLGLKVRAVAQNRAMAKAMGVRTDWVDAMTFGLGSGIAGVAGVALSQLTNVGPNLGQSYIVDSFMVVVFGGVGNLWGTLVGALSLGVANKFLEPFAGAVLAKIVILVLLILFIQKRPRGLFPQKGRAAEG